MSGVELVEVTQEDREAAAELIEWHNTSASEWHIEGGADLRFFAADMPAGVRRSIWDEHPFVQAFARHRLSSTPDVKELVEALEPFAEAARRGGIGGASISDGAGSKAALRTARAFMRIEDFGRANAAYFDFLAKASGGSSHG